MSKLEIKNNRFSYKNFSRMLIAKDYYTEHTRMSVLDEEKIKFYIYSTGEISDWNTVDFKKSNFKYYDEYKV